jgi:D-tyrosyl-tRNA(Tyr) deacylase
MRAVVQRVASASVKVGDEVTGAIGKGLLVLLGAGKGDSPQDVALMVKKVCELRIFEDPDGKMNLDLSQAQGALLVVSQFTLYGDTRKGRRPSFFDAMPPDDADALVNLFVSQARARGFQVETGRFGAHMAVSLLNDGPVTLWLDTRPTSPT